MNFRPCIDLHGGKVKQIVGSSLKDSGGGLETNFISDKPPAYYAELYKKDHLTGGHVIMLGSGNDSAATEALGAYPGGLQVGGGINADNAKTWLDRGASQVIVTSYIFQSGQLVRENLDRIVKTVGADNLVLDLSCRKRDGKYYIVTDRWQKFTTLEVNRSTLDMLSADCCEFLIHAVDVEGKQSGIDTELIDIMANNSPVPCVYAGGISTMDDIETVREIGNNRVAYTIGSALDIFGGSRLKYRDIVNMEQNT